MSASGSVRSTTALSSPAATLSSNHAKSPGSSEPGEAADEFVQGLALVAAEHPHLAEMITEQVTGRA